MTMGTGCSAIIFFKASSPFKIGISTSIVTTSGFSSFIFLIASSPFRAVPAICIRGEAEMNLSYEFDNNKACIKAVAKIVGGLNP